MEWRKSIISLAIFSAAIILSSPEIMGLTVGTSIQPGLYDAVGRLREEGPLVKSCSATLIGPKQVLTAAHCVCKGDKRTNCASRATFVLRSVFPADNPSTAVNESASRTTVSISGTLRVHPEFSIPTWMLNDMAIIDLDIPAYTVAPWIKPILVESPAIIPQLNEPLRLIGHGHTGPNCDQQREKRWLDLKTSEVSPLAIRFIYPGLRACPGDSGGAVVNASGHLVAVLSWVGTETNARPTHASINWISGASRHQWSSCGWYKVGAHQSHGRGVAWCPNGTFMTQFDLDGERNLSPHDAPIVGQVQCCAIHGTVKTWGQCDWVSVGPQSSHTLGGPWCKTGSFLTQFDLDGERNLSSHDAPVVGSAMCCQAAGNGPQYWGSTYPQPIGAQKSHQPGTPWCPNGSFLTQFDLDGERNLSPHDAPIVGKALCVRPFP